MTEFLIKLYIFHAVPIILHEFTHFIIGRLLKIHVHSIIIGWNIFRIKIKKIEISPFIFSGSIEVDKADLLRKKNISIVLFFLGASIPILFITILLGYSKFSILNTILMYENILRLFANLCPLIKYNDMNQMLEILKEKKKGC